MEVLENCLYELKWVFDFAFGLVSVRKITSNSQTRKVRFCLLSTVGLVL